MNFMVLSYLIFGTQRCHNPSESGLRGPSTPRVFDKIFFFRFSLLHLDPGEFFFEDYACIYKRGDTQNIESTWRKLLKDKTVSGKLKVS